jgi:hypothetical protein
MSVMRSFAVYKFGAAAALVALFGIAAFAQQADEEPADESEAVESIEEIIVIAPKPGSRRRVDKEYEDPTRARLLKELYELEVLEEEYEWRTSATVESPSRIKWGYDPRDDYKMRNEMDLTDLNFEQTKPATLFRLEF